MFESFDEGARRSLFFSRYEASLRNVTLIDSTHMLLGILRDRDEVVEAVLAAHATDATAIRKLFPLPDAPPPVSSSAELPLSGDAKAILARALNEAEAGGDRTVHRHTLFLAILAVADCAAARRLNELGITYEAAAALVRTISADRAARAERNERTPLSLRASHYELIDRLAEKTVLVPAELSVRRQAVALSIFDALAATSFFDAPFDSLGAATRELREHIARRWP